MLSSVAERLYWMARYLERAENTARLVNTTTNLILDLPRGTDLGWAPLVYILGSWNSFCELYDQPDERPVMKFMISDERHTSSILANIHTARENARTLRDVLPPECWEQVNELYLYAKSNVSGAVAGRRKRFDFLHEVIQRCQEITGSLAGTMRHDEAYQFVRIGRNLERADMTSRIVDVSSTDLLPHQPDELAAYANIRWMSVLKSLGAYQAYRQHVQMRVKGPNVLAFLLQDPLFPRAFAHCIAEVTGCLQTLPNNDAPLRILGRVKRRVNEADVYTLAETGLNDFVDELQLGLGEVHEAIEQAYFGFDTSVGQHQSQSGTTV